MNFQTTYNGYVETTHDALLIFQAALSGDLPIVSRRPHDRERNELVVSGSVFVFNEQSSGIKRWTDGIAWSPSRILGNFLVYRQLEKPFTPGEKKQTNKKGSYVSKKKKMAAAEPYARITPPEEEQKYQPPLPIANNSQLERALVGSLVDSYGFKKEGLIKKTMSVVVNNQSLHLVSYYKPEDILSGQFPTPSSSDFFKTITICDELLTNQNFRVPLTDNGATSASATPTRPNVKPAPVAAPTSAAATASAKLLANFAADQNAGFDMDFRQSATASAPLSTAQPYRYPSLGNYNQPPLPQQQQQQQPTAQSSIQSQQVQNTNEFFSQYPRPSLPPLGYTYQPYAPFDTTTQNPRKLPTADQQGQQGQQGQQNQQNHAPYAYNYGYTGANNW
jgi:hypothetical protein